MHFNPWARLRSLRHITVKWARLPDDLSGFAEFATHTITLSEGLTQAERRCTLWHEVIHLERGPVPAHLEAREERQVDEIVARDLIPLPALVEALLWSQNDYEIADELWVDVGVVRARMHSLTAGESADLNRALDEAELRLP